jgi:hypothetical protein
MIDGYRLILASDVLDRDGLGLEIYDESGLVAEIFRNDLTGEVKFASVVGASMPLVVLEQFVSQAKIDLLGNS